MYRERFLVLIEHLETKVTDNDFDLSTWAGTPQRPWQGNQDLSCGTVACAMGHAASIPAFQELGLKLELNLHSANISYKDSWSYLAVSEFFNISTAEARQLFSPEYYDDTSRQAACQRLRNFIST